MNPYNSHLKPVASDTIDFVPPAADVVRLYQVALWRNRLDRKHAPSGESRTGESSRRIEP